MTEDYLHYIWKYKLLDCNSLKTEAGEELCILNFGFHNHDSGPDFSEGKIKIEDTTWVGNIEIHINSSDWLKHKHQNDKAYDSVILHVVYNYDKEITTRGGSVIPTLELKNWMDYTRFEEYKKFLINPIPCISLLRDVPKIVVSSTVNQMFVERLISKTEIIKKQLKESNYNWEQVFFQQLAKSLGLNVNSIPMEQLAINTPYAIFNKLGDNPLAIESILFGQAGFLEESKPSDNYHSKLKKEYEFHKAKNSLISLSKVIWKFSKMRPPNFPTIRIAQLALLINYYDSLFDVFVKNDITVYEIKNNFKNTVNKGYWFNHFTFENESKESIKSLGKITIRTIIINTISPMLYLYGEYKDDNNYKEKAIELLEMLSYEDNKITRLFASEIKIESSLQSQGLIQCYNEYCSKKKCLECGIGINIIKK